MSLRMWNYLSDQCMGAISKSKGAGCFLLKIVARVEIHLCMQAVFIVDCASPQENPWHPFIYSHVIVNGKWRSLILVCWPFFSMKVDCPFNPCVAILILYASPIPLLCGCINPHQRWTMHLSLMDMMAASSFFFFPLQSSVTFLSMSKWWLLLVHLWNANGEVRWIFRYPFHLFIYENLK